MTRPVTNASEPAGKLVLVRHGATEWSAAGRHTGKTDLPLLPDGEVQARALHGRLASLSPGTRDPAMHQTRKGNQWSLGSLAS